MLGLQRSLKVLGARQKQQTVMKVQICFGS